MTAPVAFVDLSADDEQLVQRVARTFVSFLTAKLAHSREDVHLCLTGGTVADRIHAAVKEQLPDVLPWSRVHMWWGDERFVPQESPDRNDGQATRALLGDLPIPEENLHRFPASTAGTLDACAAEFAGHVKDAAPEQFDLVMLGTGEDAHVASLFPRHDDPHHGDVVAVKYSPKPPSQRLSLSAARLARTRECWVVASGEGKAQALHDGWVGDQVPLGALTRSVRREGGIVTWFVDRPAAQLMPGYQTATR